MVHTNYAKKNNPPQPAGRAQNARLHPNAGNGIFAVFYHPCEGSNGAITGAAVSAVVWDSPDGETSPGPAGASVEGAAVDGAAVVSTPGPPLTVPESVSPGPPVPVLSPGT